ncbi:hypothetical protein HH310_36245 [Actinoplanes sp. TBRC 11911]|uniref:SWIM zinc finger family protein n=1 Tax=Actinoplanes sp. TBRC 11911 TaxID=2729386 RepID=UPI00145D12D4|nr:hypothetical protein [Actinoplanes sp. TBRC 11911]NMO56611.1 hypothetical protein [Actinoplanes sp. TBRC 11911]
MTDFSLAFLGTFESLRLGPTFARGRRDERAGHVRSLTISTSLVVAQVRGPDDPRAFRSRIAVRAFGASDWARVEEALVAEARYTADLLAGRMPPGINAVFAGAGLSLVPLSLDEVAMDCTCERWPMPCIHLAATTYALVRSFEEDPFGAFAWRGRTRDELLNQLRELRGVRAVEATDATSARGDATLRGDAASRGDATLRGDAASRGDATLRGDVASGASRASGPSGAFDDSSADSIGLGDISVFWGEIGKEAALVAPVGSRPGSALRPDALLDQLDPPPLAHEGRPIVELLRAAYRALPEEGREG